LHSRQFGFAADGGPEKLELGALIQQGQTAIDLLEKGQREEAQGAFRAFDARWRLYNQARENKLELWDKYGFVQVARCFMRFSRFHQSAEILFEVRYRSGRGLPPEVPYLLLRSLHEAQAHALAVLFRVPGGLDKDWDHGIRQDVASLLAESHLGLGNTEQARRLLAEAIAISPQTPAANKARDALRALDDGTYKVRRESPLQSLLKVLIGTEYGLYAKKQALHCLATLKQEPVLDILVAATRTLAPELRKAAVGALGTLGDRRAAGVLLEIYESKNESQDIRDIAQLCLRELGELP
jgi:tetratricopeptide (TPR) repeat protein